MTVDVRRARTVIAAVVSMLTVAAGCTRSGPNSTMMTTTASRIDTETSFAGRTAAGNVDRGARLFAADCASCHGAGGRGLAGGSGPSLVDENARMDLAHTVASIVNPYPGMPRRYPLRLTEADVADVAAFVQTIR